MPVLSLLALGLEGTQIIISSRSPAFQDAVTSMLGVAAGGIAFGFPGFREHPWKWGAVGTLAVFASAVMDGLHPFRLHDGHSGFNWMPFMAEYANTGFQALSNVVEAALIYFPLGFLLGYFFPGSRRSAVLSLALVVVLSFSVETAQGFVAGRHSDVTDVIGAALGCLAGSLALRRGWRAYRAYVAEDGK
jgi:glycopeptide antibiotics resistance protein